MFRDGASGLLTALLAHARHHSHAHAVGTARIGHVAEHVAVLRIVARAKAEVHIVQEPLPLALLASHTPLLHVVVRPVAIVHEHFCRHVVHVVFHVDLFGNLVVVRLARKLVALEPVNHRLVIGRGTRRGIVVRIDEVDIVRVKTVARLVEVFAVAFAQVMDAVVLAVVVHDYVTPMLVIDAQAFRHLGSDTVAHVVVAAIVAEVPERESLELLEFRIIREQGVFQAFVAIFFAQGNCKRFLFFCTAILPCNLVIALDAKRRRFRLTWFKHFDIHGEFTVAPEVRTLFRVHHCSTIPCHVKAGIRAEHRKRIGRHKDCSERRLLFKNISTIDFFTRVRARSISTATQNGCGVNRQRCLYHRRICSRFSTALFATRARWERSRHRRRIESRRRNIHFGHLHLFRKDFAKRIAIRRRKSKAPLASAITRPRSIRRNSTKTHRVKHCIFGIYKVQCTAILIDLERRMRFVSAIASNHRCNLDSR